MGIFSRPANPSDNLLSAEQARAIAEAEIRCRGWTEYPDRHYRIERHKGRPVWCYSGVDVRIVGQMMQIEMDAQTGEILRASNATR